MSKFTWVAMGILAAAAVLALNLSPSAYATLPTEAQLPIGGPVTISYTEDAGAGTVTGTLISYDEQWMVLRDKVGVPHWYSMACIRNVDSGDSTPQPPK